MTLAEQMGFTDDQVVFVRTGFDEAIAPGPKDWDFNIQQYSITDQRKEAVDFSDPLLHDPAGACGSRRTAR